MKIICAGCCGDLLSQAALKAAEKADIVAAPRRLLGSAALPGNAAKCVLDAKFIADLPRFFRENDSKTILFLASGDPLYHGIGGTLRRLLPGEKILFYPAPTAFQQFFAAIGQPWEGAELFSLHAKEEELPFRRILRSRLCAVYGDAARQSDRPGADRPLAPLREPGRRRRVRPGNSGGVRHAGAAGRDRRL